jgi:ABC-type multidrug transport system permease subunit
MGNQAKAFRQLFLAHWREFARDRMGFFWTFAFIIFFVLVFHLVFSRDVDVRPRLAVEAILSAVDPAACRDDTRLTGPGEGLCVERHPHAEGRSAKDLVLPGLIALSLMQVGLFATPLPLISLRVRGVLRQLGVTPLSRVTMLSSYVAVRILIAAVQMALVCVVGIALFDLRVTGHWAGIGAVALFGLVTFVGLGFFIASVASTEETGHLIASSLQVPMIFLSNILFPPEAVPGFLQPVTNILPTTFLADALRQVMLGAAPLHGLTVDLSALAVWLVSTCLVSTWLFRWE